MWSMLHYSDRTGGDNAVQAKIRFPGSTYEHLKKCAVSRGITLNREVLRRCITPQQQRRLRLEYLAVEPRPDDPRTDAEIAAEIEWIGNSFPYDEPVPHGSPNRVVRVTIPSALHTHLLDEARVARRSLNEEITWRLMRPV